jgi:hypothetical protein
MASEVKQFALWRYLSSYAAPLVTPTLGSNSPRSATQLLSPIHWRSSSPTLRVPRLPDAVSRNGGRMSENVTPLKVRRPPKAAPARQDWLSNALADERGRLLPNLANVMIALRGAPEIEDAFSFDEILRAPILDKRLPAVDDMDGERARPFLGFCATPMSASCRNGFNMAACPKLAGRLSSRPLSRGRKNVPFIQYAITSAP